MKMSDNGPAINSGSLSGLQKYWITVSMAVAAALLVSCEKVIQLDLGNTAPKVVIQADVYDLPGPYYVKISNSVNFDQSNNYPPVTGATVQISDNYGQTEILSETSSGTYATSKLRGLPGRTYQLSVKTGGQTYQAAATMPYAVVPDTLYFSRSLFSGDRVTTIRFSDPPYIKNYYHLVYFINNHQQKAFYEIDDELFQGAAITYSLMARESDISLSNGDNVTVWLESVDSKVYEYYRTATSEGGQTASPSNPVSNISNGALGYFNAGSVRKISRTVGN